MQSVGPVTGSPNEIPDSDDVDTSLFLCVWVLYELNLGISSKSLDVGNLNEVVYALAVELEMETGILEGSGQFDDRLAQLVDLLLRRSL